MGSGNKGQAVVVVEGLGNILAKGVAGATGRDTPAAAIVGVGPQQVAHGALVWHLLDPVERPNVVERVDAGREASVKAEDLVVDQGCEGEVVEQVREVLPHVGVAVLAQALVVKAVDLRDLPRLVVPPQDRDALRVANLQRNQQRDRLDRVVASINVVTCLLAGWHSGIRGTRGPPGAS